MIQSFYQHLRGETSRTTLFLLIISMGLIVYGPSLHYGFFVLDDNFHIFIGNLKETGLSALSSTWLESKTPLIHNIWQATSLTFGTESAAPFRFLNITVHLLNTYLVFKLLVALTNSFNIKLPSNLITISTSLFLLHPIQVENVVWVSGLKDLLAFFFVLVCLLTLIQTKPLTKSARYTTIAVIFFFLAILTKPTAALIPFTIFLIPLLYRNIKPNISTLLVSALVFALISAIAFSLHVSDLDNQFLAMVDTPHKAYASLFSFYHYVTSHLMPLNLYVIYDLGVLRINRMSYNAGFIDYLRLSTPLIVILSATIFMWIKSKSYPEFKLIIIGIAFYLFALLPMLGLFPFDFQLVSIVSDRYAYFATAGLSIILTGLFASIKNTKVATFFSFTALLYLGCLGLLSVVQVSQWQSSSKILSQNPNKSYYHQIYYISALINEGDEEESFNLITSVLEDDPGAEEAYGLMTELLRLYTLRVSTPEFKDFYDKYRYEVPPYLYYEVIRSLLILDLYKTATFYFNRYERHSPAPDPIDFERLQTIRRHKRFLMSRDNLLELAFLATHQHRFERAEKYIEFLKEDFPNDPHVEEAIQSFRHFRQ